MLRYEAESSAPPRVVWPLLAEPARWHEWAPHVRGAIRLGAPEVEAGRVGVVRLAGVVPVPARITAKQAGRSWTRRVGAVTLHHEVRRRRGGSIVALEIEANGAVEAGLRATYGPLCALLIRRLARRAAA